MQDYIICYKCNLKSIEQDVDNFIFSYDEYICEDCFHKKKILEENNEYILNLEKESEIKYQKWKIQNQK